MSAQTVEDEDYQLRHERVAGIDVAKGSAMVCLRLPPGPGKTRRTSRTWEVTARVPDIEELAAGLKASCVERVSMESTSVIRGANDMNRTLPRSCRRGLVCDGKDKSGNDEGA